MCLDCILGTYRTTVANDFIRRTNELLSRKFVHAAMKGAFLVKDVSAHMHTYFVPQMEQLGLQEQSAKHGSLSMMNSEIGSGILWAHSISDECLFTFHEMTLTEAVELTEFPEEYICLSSMTGCSARHCPINCRRFRDRNVVSFHQGSTSVTCTLKPQEHHRSYTLCMKPTFFDTLKITDAEKDLLRNYLSSCDVNTLPRKTGLALESLNPSWANCSGGDIFVEAKANEALMYALNAAVKDVADDPWGQFTEDRKIAREAQAIIDERFAENLSLQSIASELYVGRTKLCEIFREQIGSCVAEYLRDRRMSEACMLLETTDMKAADIADAVGYAHLSSFTEAFRKTCGCTPSQWRKDCCS